VEVAKKKAACLTTMAIDRKSKALFDQANHELLGILQQQWDWETGHRYRIDLYAQFDKLKVLLEEYDKIHRRIPSRAGLCDKIILNIQLVSRFRDDLPLEPVTLADAGEGALLWRSFWPLVVGLFGGLSMLKGVSYLQAFKGASNNFKLLMIQMLIAICFFILVIWCSARYKKTKQRAAGHLKI